MSRSASVGRQPPSQLRPPLATAQAAEHNNVVDSTLKVAALLPLTGKAMKKGIHTNYVPARVTCACGNTFETRATVPELKVEICNLCHPFYTGKQKFVDTAGRVERFQKKFGGDYFRRSAGEQKSGGGR